MICYAVKDDDGYYWCGMNHWDNQLRKALFYNSLKYASAILKDKRFKDRNMKIITVELHEVSE